jgi:hypothetical protein
MEMHGCNFSYSEDRDRHTLVHGQEESLTEKQAKKPKPEQGALTKPTLPPQKQINILLIITLC